MTDTMTLDITSRGTVKVKGFTPKKPRKNAKPRANARIHIVGSTGAARAHVYSPTPLPEGTVIKLDVADADTKALDHGEERFIWTDDEANILVKAFLPLAERGRAKRFKLTV